MFKFVYRMLDKLCLEKEAGFFLEIDDNHKTIEYCTLDSKNKIINNFFCNINSETMTKIRNILEDNNNLFLLNSNVYSKGDYSEIEQMFYFELDNINRKIEGNNIFDKYIDNKSINLLINVFNKISNVLLKENIVLKLDSLTLV